MPYRLANPQSAFGAGEENRTLTTSLEGWGSTIELHPQMWYKLLCCRSFVNILRRAILLRKGKTLFVPLLANCVSLRRQFCFAKLYMVEGEGFEPSKSLITDLQSAPFGHSGTPPRLKNETGAGDGTRTRDLLITSQLLYQLSYTGKN